MDVAILPYGASGSTRLAELPVLPEADWTGRYGDDRRWLLTADGAPAGRLWVGREPDGSDRILDLALLPAVRGQRLPALLIGHVVALAHAEDRSVVADVTGNAAAYRLFRALGFVETADGTLSHEPPARVQRIRELVWAEPALEDELIGFTSLEALAARVAEIGRDKGIAVSPASVQAAAAAGRRDALERWIE